MIENAMYVKTVRRRWGRWSWHVRHNWKNLEASGTSRTKRDAEDAAAHALREFIRARPS